MFGRLAQRYLKEGSVGFTLPGLKQLCLVCSSTMVWAMLKHVIFFDFFVPGPFCVCVLTIHIITRNRGAGDQFS